MIKPKFDAGDKVIFKAMLAYPHLEGMVGTIDKISKTLVGVYMYSFMEDFHNVDFLFEPCMDLYKEDDEVQIERNHKFSEGDEVCIIGLKKFPDFNGKQAIIDDVTVKGDTVLYSLKDKYIPVKFYINEKNLIPGAQFKKGDKVIINNLFQLSEFNDKVGTISKITVTNFGHLYSLEESMFGFVMFFEKNLKRYIAYYGKKFKNNYLKKKDIVIGRYLFSLYDGWIKVTDITKHNIIFDNGEEYTIDGKYSEDDKYPSLFSKVPKGFKDPNKFIDDLRCIDVGCKVWTISDGWVTVDYVTETEIITNNYEFYLDGRWSEGDLFPTMFAKKPECFN